jgi:hypothetical protein
MAGITKRDLASPDESVDFLHGRSEMVQVGEVAVWRSELHPGWNWDEDIKPHTDGLTSCPLTHHEYVVSGRVRYLMDDGTEEIGDAGNYLFIEPGHRAWVLGDQTCVLIDW